MIPNTLQVGLHTLPPIYSIIKNFGVIRYPNLVCIFKKCMCPYMLFYFFRTVTESVYFLPSTTTIQHHCGCHTWYSITSLFTAAVCPVHATIFTSEESETWPPVRLMGSCIHFDKEPMTLWKAGIWNFQCLSYTGVGWVLGYGKVWYMAPEMGNHCLRSWG